MIAEGVGFEVPVIGTIPDAYPYVAVAQSRGELPHSWMIDELEPFRAAFDDLAERLGLTQPSDSPHRMGTAAGSARLSDACYAASGEMRATSGPTATTSGGELPA